MADLAFVFHWPLSEMMAMQIEDLALWHQKAVERYKGSGDE